MNVLNRLIIKNIKLNKKRSLVTIIGIMLSVALICAVGVMVTSYNKTLLEHAIKETGYYHVEVDGVTIEEKEQLKLNRDVKDVKEMYTIGYSNFQCKDEEYPYINVYSMDKENFKELSYDVLEGRLPENEGEVVVNKNMIYTSDYEVGDEIELNVGRRVSKDNEEIHESITYSEDMGESIVEGVTYRYKIVGVVDKERWNQSSSYAITTNTTSNSIKAYIVLENPADYKNSFVKMFGVDSYADIEGYYSVIDNKGYNVNSELLRWEAFAFSDATTDAIVVLAAILMIIIVAISVFCIRNSFAISITEKMKMYGMLASVGTTKKQIRKSVVFEGFILGIWGILSGLLLGNIAIFVLIKILNGLLGNMLFEDGTKIIMDVSWLPIIAAVILGIITIYLSTISVARRASKVSPIENIRNTTDIKISSKKLKTPKVIKKIFKTGGVIAYKNLKRSKKKYRTTVISIIISVFAFISMNGLINEVKAQGLIELAKMDYDIVVNCRFADNFEYKENDIEKIINIKGIDKSKVVYKYDEVIEVKQKNNIESEEFFALDEEVFKEYAKKVGVNYNEIENKAIACYGSGTLDKDGYGEERRYKYSKGDVVTGTFLDSKEEITLELEAVTVTKMPGYGHIGSDNVYFVVNKAYYPDYEWKGNIISLYTDKSYEVHKEIKKLYPEASIQNVKEEVESYNSIVIIYSIFLYGFIAVVTLIGVTNVFNTITANIELRQKEFAMLKSVGMTRKEFNNMVNLETLFYSIKALVFGIILGVGGAYLINKAMGIRQANSFQIPFVAIIISIVFVLIMVYAIMKYSISKINKQNTIETIRKENV